MAENDALEPETDASTDGNAIDLNSPEIQQLVKQETDRLKQEAERSVLGLKNKVGELLAKLKKKDERLNAFGEYDPEQVHQVMKKFDDDEYAKLLKAGDIDAVFKRIDERTINRFSKQIESRDNALKEAEERQKEIEARADDYLNKYHHAVINNAIATEVEDLEDGALPHVQRMVEGWYEADENNRPIPTDRAPLNGKGNPLPFAELKQYLLDTAPFCFRQSRGGKLATGKAGSNGKRVLTRSQFRDLPEAHKEEFSKSVRLGKAELID